MAKNPLRGPDVAAVGWIPFFENLSDLPAGHQYPLSVPMRLLFNSGNPEPKNTFGGFPDFEQWLYPLHPTGTREYRAALYLRDIVLHDPSDGSASRVEYEHGAFIGFTPPRFMAFGINVSPLRGYHQGVGPDFDPEEEELPNGRGIQIRYRIEFKLAFSMDLLVRSITGYWAPFAWMEIDYRIFKTGRVEVDFRGTAIPSQTYYVGWNRVHHRDMLLHAKPEIDGFLNITPGCMAAPEGARFRCDNGG